MQPLGLLALILHSKFMAYYARNIKNDKILKNLELKIYAHTFLFPGANHTDRV